MVSAEDVIIDDPVYDIKVSSVGPERVTGQNVIHEPTNMDLAMKLHYLRGVYFFRSSSVQGQSIYTIKEAMFLWLNLYYHTCGRLRRSESGRPFIKCNDCGTRIIEAQCKKTIDEWLEMRDNSLHNRLVSNQVIGPELGFSPLVLIQLTTFKCGGMSVGLSWAHVLGDAFSACAFINMWGQVLGLVINHKPPPSPSLPNSETKARKSQNQSSLAVEPLSVKRVDPVGDLWVTANNCKMENFSFQITAKQLNDLQSKMLGKNQSAKIPPFESLSAVIWQCLAKIREGSEPRVVTVCRNGSHNRKNGTLSNNQTISVVQADFSIAEAHPKELAALIMEHKVDEKSHIEELIGDQGMQDLIIYGANLTFVDLEEADLYGLELNKEKPVLANYTIDGIGDGGVILVLTGPENVGENGGKGRTVTAILPEKQLSQLKDDLQREWCIA